MEIEPNSMKAIHLGDGNYFDNLRIDIQRSHQFLDAVLTSRPTKRISRSRFVSYSTYLLNGALQQYKLQEFVITNGLKREWFEEFHDYWTNVLGGRPLTITDFMMLLHDYRKRQQHTTTLQWESPQEHIQNWQDPNQLYAILSNVRKMMLYPIVGRNLWGKVKKGQTILEYGCSTAPFYDCYRHFFLHLHCQWILADIPNFAFHYAKYTYRHDPDVRFVTIQPTDFKEPLKELTGIDVIILRTVLEHLDDPLYISDYLLDRLNPGGLFVFDYMITDGKGLDTPKAQTVRADCLHRILERVNIIHGHVDISQNVGLCIGQKVA